MPPTTTTSGRTHAGGIQPSASFFRPSRPNQHNKYPSQRDVFALENISNRDSDASEHNGNKVFNLRRGMSIDNGEDSITQEFDDDDPTSSKAHEEAVDIGRYKSSPPASSQNHNDLGISRARRRDRRQSSNTDVSSSFIPSTRPLMTSLAVTPKVNPKYNRPYRNHELHPSRNRFFCNGRLLTGGDSPWAFIFCFIIVLAICGLWFGTTCPWYWSNLGGGGKAIVIIGAYLAAIVITSMLTTASMDPGILPRDLDPDPPYPSTSPSDGGVRAPMPRDLKVRSDVVRVKYCPTCKTYRPPRSSHCKMCDNCVDGCDHHCQWVNNCIGKRNYTTFFFLLLSATISLILIITTSALHIFLLTEREGLDFRHAIGRSDGAGSAATFILSILVFWPVAALFSYHIRLVLLNVTTIEQIRNQAHKTLVPGPAPPNPFSHGTWRRNMMAVLCRATGYSWIDPSGIATEDKREVNPGLSGEGVPGRR